MKKFTFILLTVASSLAFVNCSSDDDKGTVMDCYQHGNKVADAGIAYSQNATDANCIAYRDALKAAINDGCMATTYQSWLDELPCNN